MRPPVYGRIVTIIIIPMRLGNQAGASLNLKLCGTNPDSLSNPSQAVLVRFICTGTFYLVRFVLGLFCLEGV
jgi:hypothetical protein